MKLKVENAKAILEYREQGSQETAKVAAYPFGVVIGKCEYVDLDLCFIEKESIFLSVCEDLELFSFLLTEISPYFNENSPIYDCAWSIANKGQYRSFLELSCKPSRKFQLIKSSSNIDKKILSLTSCHDLANLIDSLKQVYLYSLPTDWCTHWALESYIAFVGKNFCDNKRVLNHFESASGHDEQLKAMVDSIGSRHPSRSIGKLSSVLSSDLRHSICAYLEMCINNKVLDFSVQ